MSSTIISLMLLIRNETQDRTLPGILILNVQLEFSYIVYIYDAMIWFIVILFQRFLIRGSSKLVAHYV